MKKKPESNCVHLQCIEPAVGVHLAVSEAASVGAMVCTPAPRHRHSTGLDSCVARTFGVLRFAVLLVHRCPLPRLTCSSWPSLICIRVGIPARTWQVDPEDQKLLIWTCGVRCTSSYGVMLRAATDAAPVCCSDTWLPSGGIVSVLLGDPLNPPTLTYPLIPSAFHP